MHSYPLIQSNQGDGGRRPKQQGRNHGGVFRYVCIMSLALSIVPATALGAVSRVPSSTGAVLNDPTLTTAAAERWDRMTRQKEAAYGVGEVPALACMDCQLQGDIGIQCLPAPGKYAILTKYAANYKQETGVYCGPASARQSLSWHKYKSGSSTALPSQTTLAGLIGTGPSGSATTGIASALNSYSGAFGTIAYVASDLTNTTDPLNTFYDRIGTMLRASVGTIPIPLVETKYIPRYSGAQFRHYMSIKGLDDRTAPVRVATVDPHYDSKYYGIYWDQMGCTVHNGVCRACYQADVNGSNRAMAW